MSTRVWEQIVEDPSTEREQSRRRLPGWAVVGLMLAGLVACGDSATTATDASADSAAPTAVNEPTFVPTATSSPVLTAPPAPTATAAPTATPVPAPTATPEPLDRLTLADVQAGRSGTNWIANLGGVDVPFVGLVEPDGEPFPTSDISLDWLTDVLVVSGTPDDEWVEILVGWVEPNGQTAWIRSADVTFSSSEVVLEIVRSTGELQLWRDGDVVWSDTDLTSRESAALYTPFGVGYVVGRYPSGEFGGRQGPTFHPDIVGLSFVLVDFEADRTTPLGIRGLNEGLLDQQEGVPGGLIWIDSPGLIQLFELAPPGTRVEIVE